MARLNGSSLVEATVALALLTVVMGVAWLSFEQLLSNSKMVQEFQAELLMRQRAQQIKQQSGAAVGSWDTLGYVIHHKMEPVLETTDLMLLQLQCESPDKHVFYFDKIIRFEP